MKSGKFDDNNSTDPEEILAKIRELVINPNETKNKSKLITSRRRIEEVWSALDPEVPATSVEVALKTNISKNMVQRALYTLLAEGRAKREKHENAFKYIRTGEPSLEPKEAMRRFNMEKLRAAIPQGPENALPVSDIAKLAGVNPVTARVKLQLLEAKGEVGVVQMRSTHNQPVWGFYRE